MILELSFLGAVNAVVYGLDRETFSRLTPSQLKVHYKVIVVIYRLFFFFFFFVRKLRFSFKLNLK